LTHRELALWPRQYTACPRIRSVYSIALLALLHTLTACDDRKVNVELNEEFEGTISESQPTAASQRTKDPFDNVVTDVEREPYSRNNPESRFDDQVPPPAQSPNDKTGGIPAAGRELPQNSRFDANASFPITPREAGFLQPLQEVFDLLDDDQDGLLSAAEFSRVGEFVDPRRKEYPDTSG